VPILPSVKVGETETVTAAEAAEIIGIRRDAVLGLRARGELPRAGIQRGCDHAWHYVFEREKVEAVAADRLLRASDDARFLGVSRETLDLFVKRGEVRALRVTPGQGHRRFRFVSPRARFRSVSVVLKKRPDRRLKEVEVFDVGEVVGAREDRILSVRNLLR
jgi:hypothetical protein